MNDSPALANTSCDDLLPTQLLDRVLLGDGDIPERRLLVAVLADAVRCLQSGSVKERTEVFAWMRSAYGPARFSFGALCDALGLEVDLVARRLRTLASETGTVQRVHRTRGRRQATVVPLPARNSDDPPKDCQPPILLSVSVTASRATPNHVD